jgi:pyruvate kinase
VARLEDIIEVSDALMVARGDLGVEMPLEKVPGIQKRIIRMGRRFGKPVVVATQMLESMITSPVPTRAEVSDVGTAVFEGADAVMLSAESAAGQFPVEAVATMSRIAEEIESDPHYPGIIAAQRNDPEHTGADAIAAAARQIAETIDLKAIVAWTMSGSTALRIARERPQTPVLMMTPSLQTARRMTLLWGVHAVVGEDINDVAEMAEKGAAAALEQEFARPGQRIILVAGVPFGTPGSTNMIRIAFVNADAKAR